MKLNKNNLFARYYEWIYGNLPNDVCSFFWGSVLIIGLFPILVVGRLFCGSYHTNFSKVLVVSTLSYVAYTFATLLGLIMYGGFVLDLGEIKFNILEHYHLLELSWYGLLLGMPLMTLGVMLVIVVGLGIHIGIIWLIFKLLKITVINTEQTVLIQNAKDFVGAIRGKYCTKINWN